MSITQDLAQIYDKQAKKYYQTRQKHRADKILFMEILQEYINSDSPKILNILEFWVWGWRFSKEVLLPISKNNPNLKIKYTGVDISTELIKLAKKDFPNWKFIVSDIQEYMSTTKQEEFDIVIWIASFQHIFWNRQRQLLMKKFYRSLKFDGILIMQNWSFSSRFFKKYKKELSISLRSYIKSFWKKMLNDVFISFNQEPKPRYYHIFTLYELKKLASKSWFKIKKLSYIGRSWNLDEKMKNSKTSLSIFQKKVI